MRGDGRRRWQPGQPSVGGDAPRNRIASPQREQVT